MDRRSLSHFARIAVVCLLTSILVPAGALAATAGAVIFEGSVDRAELSWGTDETGNLTDELRKVYKNCLEKLTEYSTEVSQNAALCNAWKKLAERDDFKDLNEAQRKAVENTLRTASKYPNPYSRWGAI